MVLLVAEEVDDATLFLLALLVVKQTLVLVYSAVLNLWRGGGLAFGLRVAQFVALPFSLCFFFLETAPALETVRRLCRFLFFPVEVRSVSAVLDQVQQRFKVVQLRSQFCLSPGFLKLVESAHHLQDLAHGVWRGCSDEWSARVAGVGDSVVVGRDVAEMVGVLLGEGHHLELVDQLGVPLAADDFMFMGSEVAHKNYSCYTIRQHLRNTDHPQICANCLRIDSWYFCLLSCRTV